jgi:outer membrane lipoprotein-sorting protein
MGSRIAWGIALGGGSPLRSRGGSGLGSKARILALTLLLGASAAQGAGDVVSSADADDAARRACVETAVAAVQRRYESVRDLRADFVQTSRSVAFGDPAGGAGSESRGSVAFAKPGRCAGRTNSPSRAWW